MRYTAFAFLFVLLASCGVEGSYASGIGASADDSSDPTGDPSVRGDDGTVEYPPITSLPDLGGPCYNAEGFEVCQAQRLCDFESRLVVNDVAMTYLDVPCSMSGLLVDCQTRPGKPFPPSVEEVEQRRVKYREEILGGFSDFCRRHGDNPQQDIQEMCKLQAEHPFSVRDKILNDCRAQQQ